MLLVSRGDCVGKKAGVAEDQKKRQDRERQKKKEPLLKQNQWLIQGEVRILKMIGSGGFGQIYEAVDKQGVTMAVKAGERNTKNAPRMVLEQFLLQRVSSHKNFPQFFRSGSTDNINFICMELLGPNLHELRKLREDKRFSPNTAFQVACQVTDALRVLHNGGYIHRDVKPSNMCVSLQEPKTVVLVDFGLSRRYLQPNGDLRQFREYAGFRGTARYVSPRVHEHQEHTVWDDFWGLCYSMIEMIDGQLPWRNQSDHKALYQMKMQYIKYIECRGSTCIRQLLHYLKNAKATDRVDYNRFKKFMKHAIDPEEPLDWESDYLTTEDSTAETSEEESREY
ncbi:unnamed protein product [Bursaphelenchus xylophilus]|uniref:non-specific serine/threonine protein kinase n=1 Tax=Bursaphelenchus xylophilus TaxID=6326 RepID=A0A1I7SS25_BURXY|nr:unnamed protein product [Bursaphelenchus xylophilus]CAG9105764.1 unnamed protein product [Bursaphelenchus xylophilus]